MVVPGERLTAESVLQIEQYLKEGLNVQGLDKAVRIRVLRDGK